MKHLVFACIFLSFFQSFADQIVSADEVSKLYKIVKAGSYEGINSFGKPCKITVDHGDGRGNYFSITISPTQDERVPANDFYLSNTSFGGVGEAGARNIGINYKFLLRWNSVGSKLSLIVINRLYDSGPIKSQCSI